jgi:endonuclease III
MAASRQVADLRTCLDKLDADLFNLGPRPEEMTALERLLCLCLQGDAALSVAEKAVRTLRNRYGNWSEVRVARHFEIRDVLKAGRVAEAEERATRAQEYLRRVFGLQNHLELDWLYDATSERRARMLNQLTMAPLHSAAVLDLDAWERDEPLPIDKDLKRVLGRLGLVKANPKEAEVRELLEPIFEGDGLYTNFVKLRVLADLGADPRNPQSRGAQALQTLWEERKSRAQKAFAQAAAELGLPLSPAMAKMAGKLAPSQPESKPAAKAAKKKAVSKAKAAPANAEKAPAEQAEPAKKAPVKKAAKKKAAKKKVAKKASKKKASTK